MNTYTQILYQIVFSTKKRETTLNKNNREKLYRYIHGICTRKKCILYRIGGVDDHIHIVIYLHPSVSVADFVRDIKIASSKYIKHTGIFPGFTSWQEGYSAFTYSVGAKQNLINYVKNQESHHSKISFIDEVEALLSEHKINYDKKYLPLK